GTCRASGIRHFLITSDKNISAQQNLRGRNLSIIVLPTNLRRQVMERAADIVDTINRIKLRQYVVIEPGGRRLMFDFDSPGAAPSEKSHCNTSDCFSCAQAPLTDRPSGFT